MRNITPPAINIPDAPELTAEQKAASRVASSEAPQQVGGETQTEAPKSKRRGNGRERVHKNLLISTNPDYIAKYNDVSQIVKAAYKGKGNLTKADVFKALMEIAENMTIDGYEERFVEDIGRDKEYQHNPRFSKRDDDFIEDEQGDYVKVMDPIAKPDGVQALLDIIIPIKKRENSDK